MNAFSDVGGLERWQARIIRRMMILSFVAHGAVILLGSGVSSLFPPREFSPPVTVELTDAPLSELPEDLPAFPAPPPTRAETAKSPSEASAPARTASKPAPAARKWLDRVDAGLAKVPEAPVARKEGKAGGIPVRQWSNEGAVKPGDFAPAVAPERAGILRNHMEELEARVRHSGRPAVGVGKETEASMMFGGTGDAAGEPIPAWIRDMIRKRVRDYLPELEGVYADAIRRNQDLKGKLLVRFRIDPSGKIRHAESVEESFRDAAFVNDVLEKVRRWTFEPTAGRTVEVFYPFVFIAPS